MRRAAIAMAAVLVAVTPAGAQFTSFRAVAQAFCHAVVSGDMAPVLDNLTEGLRRALGPRGEVPILWLGEPETVETCHAVGNSGTRDRPETIVALGSPLDPSGFSLTIIMVVVDGQLWIDDVEFADGSTLRERLAVRALAPRP